MTTPSEAVRDIIGFGQKKQALAQKQRQDEQDYSIKLAELQEKRTNDSVTDLLNLSKMYDFAEKTGNLPLAQSIMSKSNQITATSLIPGQLTQFLTPQPQTHKRL